MAIRETTHPTVPTTRKPRRWLWPVIAAAALAACTLAIVIATNPFRPPTAPASPTVSGTWTVGYRYKADWIVPGRYTIRDATDQCRWFVDQASEDYPDGWALGGGGLGPGFQVVTLDEGQRLRSYNCPAWVRS